MDISCDIIRDLLPLYAEELVSEDSRKLVSGHLHHCDACSVALAELKKITPVAADTSAASLGKVKKSIRRRRMLSVLAAVLTLLTLSSMVNIFLHAPFQLTMEQALDDFYVREDGAVILDYSPYVIGRSLSGMNENWFVHQYSTRYNVWKGDNRKSIDELYGSDGIITEEEKRRYENIDVVYGTWESTDGKVKSDAPIPWLEDAVMVSGGNDWNWWYFDPAGLGQDTLLYDAGKEFPEKEYRIHFAPMYPILFFGGTGLSLALFTLNRFTKKSWLKELSMRLQILTTSLVLSTLFVSNGRIFTSDVGVIDQYWGPMIGTNAVFLTLTILFWRQLYLLNKQDQTI